MKNLKNFFFKKKVIITGHTGFKGAWLTFWLNRLGANVMGLSDKIPTKPSFFQACKIEKSIDHKVVDLSNYKELENKITSFKPD